MDWCGVDRRLSNCSCSTRTGPDSWETLESITLNGKKDPNAEIDLCVEYESWKAVWRDVPEYMPGSYPRRKRPG